MQVPNLITVLCIKEYSFGSALMLFGGINFLPAQGPWTTVNSPGPSTLDFASISFLNDTTGVVVGNNFTSFTGYTMTTMDGGNTWNMGTNIVPGMTSLGMIDTATGWGVGQLGDAITTTDGGDTWTPENKPVMDQLNSLSITETYVYAAGFSNGIIRKEHGIVAGRPGPEPALTVKVFPNPFREMAWIELTGTYPQQMDLLLMDLEGKILLERTGLNGPRVGIPGDGLEAGVYFAWLKAEGGTVAIARVVKE